MDMKSSLLIKGVMIGAALPLLAGCIHRTVVYTNPAPVVVTAPAPAPAPAVVDEAPPAVPAAPADVVTVAPGPPDAWFWVPGAWEWNGRWVWTGGHWVSRPRPNAVWVTSHWEVRHGHRVWVTGRWR
jgi:hypothetical protein